MLSLENEKIISKFIIGIDEVGRGPLAGPVVSSAVRLSKNFKTDDLNDSKKIEELSEITFLSDKNESLKKLIIASLLKGNDQDTIKSKISVDYKKLIDEIQENSSIQIILKNKSEEAILELLNELIAELKELNNLKKIESLEKELINNLDENSYSELIKLKNQLNRE